MKTLQNATQNTHRSTHRLRARHPVRACTRCPADAHDATYYDSIKPPNLDGHQVQVRDAIWWEARSQTVIAREHLNCDLKNHTTHAVLDMANGVTVMGTRWWHTHDLRAKANGMGAKSQETLRCSVDRTTNTKTHTGCQQCAVF